VHRTFKEPVTVRENPNPKKSQENRSERRLKKVQKIPEPSLEDGGTLNQSFPLSIPFLGKK